MRKNKNHIIGKSGKDIGPRDKTVELDKLQEGSNRFCIGKTRDLKRSKLYDVHYSNLRLRLYRELNVVRNPIKSTFKSASWSLSKPVAMNREPLADCSGIDHKPKSSLHVGSTRESMDWSDDECIFALDL